MPVLPLVHSMSVLPGASRPSASASSMICRTARSLRLSGFMNSHLA